jgi:hypothetical protein
MNRYKELRAQISRGKTAEKEKAKVRPAAEDKPAVESAVEDQPVTLTEPSAQPDKTEVTEESIPAQEAEPVAGTGSEASAASLAAAVEEIKKYIHEEISALKEEIKALRSQ